MRTAAGLGFGVVRSFVPSGPRKGGGGGSGARPSGVDGRRAEAAKRPPEQAVGDSQWTAGAARARNENG